jgi:dTDP-glucose pyrophosphorylase
MKAVILAAGKGARMRHLVKETPKPMLLVHGKPILEHIVEGLANGGIHDICIVTGYLAETIETYFGTGEKWKARITYVRQEAPEGTARAALLARDFVGDDSFVLSYADILVRPDAYARMLYAFDEKLHDGLVTVTVGEDIRKGGLYFFDEDFILTKVVEKPTDEELVTLEAEGHIKIGTTLWYNAGIYFFKSKMFQYAEVIPRSSRGEYELTDVIALMIKDGNKLKGLKLEGLWADVRDPEVLAALDTKLGEAR